MCAIRGVLFAPVKKKQGKTVNKLQIATFWDIYIHTYIYIYIHINIHIYIYIERERDIIKFCVSKMPAAARGLHGSEANSLGQTDRPAKNLL